MQPRSNPHDRLEQALHRVLRGLPPRRAPRTLEARVIAELELRAALPWWRRNYAYWPFAVRVAFLVGSAGVVKLVLMAAVWAMAGFDNAQFAQAIAPQFAALDAVATLGRSVTEACGAVFRSLPAWWLYAAATVVAALYAALFGLGAAAYRTLYANR